MNADRKKYLIRIESVLKYNYHKNISLSAEFDIRAAMEIFPCRTSI
jgi:hypothetical protein